MTSLYYILHINITPLDYLLAKTFSDRHNPNEAPRLPSPNHGNVACRVRKYFNFVGYGGCEVN